MSPDVADPESPPVPRRRWPVQRLLLAMAAALVALATVTAVFAQQGSGFDLHWTATSSGGGDAHADGFAVYGSVGQPIAGHSSASGFTVDSGYLGGAVQKIFRYIPFIARDAD
ncbi:MAG: hypothetical protein ACM3S1_10170 [Hyphomicrobiales bacterium]